LPQSSLALVSDEEESIAVNRTVVFDPLLFTTTASRRKRYPFLARGASFFLTPPFPHSFKLPFALFYNENPCNVLMIIVPL
jgi:hypothetical protein